ncbi:MAG: diaminopimelate epimerase [Syntrophomonadaceae bacterium]|jgi:diaminopimelate epimerase
MKFVKMHGLGNDFVVVESPCWDNADLLQKHARSLCNRNFGIGADGVLVIGKDTEADIFMRIFNSDGSEAEMCGNGIRCAARYAFERNLIKHNKLMVRTLAGIRCPEILCAGDNIKAVKVDMGEPVLDCSLIPMKCDHGNIKVKVTAAGRDFVITGVSMGNPHCVVLVDSIDQVPVQLWGPQLENHEIFPARSNVEFVQVINRNEVVLRVWERGAGVTLACGTGACAGLVACVLNGVTEREAVVHLTGGDLLVSWNESDNHVYMTGPAEEVFSGDIAL